MDPGEWGVTQIEIELLIENDANGSPLDLYILDPCESNVDAATRAAESLSIDRIVVSPVVVTAAAERKRNDALRSRAGVEQCRTPARGEVSNARER